MAADLPRGDAAQAGDASRLAVAIHHVQGAFTLDATFNTPLRGVTALFGASGAGKTTVVRAIAGLAQPQRARIALGERVLVDTAARVDLPIDRRGLGYVFQDARLFPHLDVSGNLRYGERRVRDRPLTLRFDDIVELLGIGQLLRRRVAALSGGERQRVALGRALLSQPRLLLLDEPLAALDNARRAEILPYIERLRDNVGIPIVYVSHALDEVMRLATAVVLMAEGRVVATGTVEEVFSRTDLRPYVGQRFDAGTVLATRIVAHVPADALTLCELADGPDDAPPRIALPQVDAVVGTQMRVRILARDVSLALSEPLDTSIGNRWHGVVDAIVSGEGPYVDVRVRIGPGAALWALVTRTSVTRMGLAVGLPLWCLVKTVALETGSQGMAAAGR